MIDKEEWTEVETPSSDTEENKVEFEIEEDQTVQAEASSTPEPKEEKSPEELEGIETKGAQKRIRQLIRQRKDRDTQISELIQKNEELTGRLTAREKEFTNINKLNLDANEKQVTDKLELARAAYKSAHEEGDSTKILKAQEFLNDAQNDLKNIGSTKAQFEQEYVEKPLEQQQQQQPVQQTHQADPMAMDWSQKNEWFGKDRVMTAAALAVDAELKEEGFDPSDPEFYNEIDNRIKEAFPQKFNNPINQSSVQEQPSQPAQVVAGASRSTPTPGKVKLTKEDVRLAQNWGIPLEQYAAEKAKVQSADGDYTAIKL